MHATSVIFMVRPAAFGYNMQTAGSNAFQEQPNHSHSEIQQQALHEFDQMVALLRSEGVEVLVLPDVNKPQLPDAVFPNNWVSFHQEMGAVLYPMQAENRRLERRPDLADWLSANGFAPYELLDLRAHEQNGLYLEGTGSLVLDRQHKRAYASLSSRTHPELVRQWCAYFGYEPVLFEATDTKGSPIYHTNVLMAIGEKVAVICAEAIAPKDRDRVLQTLAKDGKELVQITHAQMNAFAGNMLELLDTSGNRLMVMSEQARKALTKDQLATISRHNRVVSPNVSTIEKHGGGSVRCMMAEVFLSRQTGQNEA